jgi:hypothetical protein
MANFVGIVADLSDVKVEIQIYKKIIKIRQLDDYPSSFAKYQK